MSRRPVALALMVLLALMSRARAGKGTLQLIPADATAALAIRDLNDLRKKGDALVASADAKRLPRISELFDELYRGLGITGGVDEDASAAIVVVNPQLFHIELFDKDGQLSHAATNNVQNLLVGALPFRDRDKLAASFGFKKGELKPDTMASGSARLGGHMRFLAHGNHLFLGWNDKAILSVARGKRAGADLPAGQRRLLDDADVLLHLRREPLAPAWKQFVHKDLQHTLDPARKEEPKGQGAAGGRTLRSMIDALDKVDAVSFVVRVGKGVGVNLLATYPKDGGKTAQVLRDTLGGTGRADLRGLSDGRVLAAEAWRVNGGQNTAVARTVIHALHDLVLQTKLKFSAADEPMFVGVFNEVWEHLHGTRLAVYQNPDPHQQGLLGAVAILDTEDAGAFLSTMKRLARLAGPEPSASASVSDQPAIEPLIRDLGARKFRVREAASHRLLLIGEPALPYLDKALQSADLERVRRAKAIKGRIVTVAAERRKELLSQNGLGHLHPTLSFARRPELRQGQTVEVVHLQLVGARPTDLQALRSLFGPDWQTIRLAAHGKQVAVLIGSNQDLLWKTVQNLKEGKPGLAAAPPLASFNKLGDTARQLELHLSLHAAIALMTGADLASPKATKTTPHLTSLALTAGSDALRLDFWLPAGEIKTFEELNGPHY